MPRVSVIIPTFRRPQLLRAAIESVLAQTFQDFEIVVVDDHSGDTTAQVVGSFADARIRYIEHRTNWRVAAARNTGVLNSSGEFVAFLDDDDEWLPDKLARQLAAFEARAPITGAVYTGFVMIDRQTGSTVHVVTPTKGGHILHELCRHNCVGTASTVVIRRECFRVVGLFDETIDFGEEYDMWIRIAHAFDFAFLADPLVRYSVHGRRLSTNFEAMILGLQRQLAKSTDFFAAYPEDLSRRYIKLGILSCYAGKGRLGRSSFRRAIRISPLQLRNYYYWGLGLLGSRAFRTIRSWGRAGPGFPTRGADEPTTEAASG